MTHISRHSRPLPQIPGISVVEDVEVPREFVNNFDLHLPRPTAIHPVRERLAEIGVRPTGVVKEAVRKMYGQRIPIDDSAAHEAAVGARLVGITWPAEHAGEWIFCWHDGVFASIPTDVVKIDPPSAATIKMGGTSQVRAKARWRFATKDKEKDWLKFDKDEIITNISCTYQSSPSPVNALHFKLTSDITRATRRSMVLVWFKRKRKMGSIPPRLY